MTVKRKNCHTKNIFKLAKSDDKRTAAKYKKQFAKGEWEYYLGTLRIVSFKGIFLVNILADR